MKPATITTVLQEKLKEMQKYLARFEKDQKEMRKEKNLVYAHDMLEGLSHQIGYMNGAIEQTKQFLEMIEMSDKQFFDDRKTQEENMRQIKEQLREAIGKVRIAKKVRKGLK